MTRPLFSMVAVAMLIAAVVLAPLPSAVAKGSRPTGAGVGPTDERRYGAVLDTLEDRFAFVPDDALVPSEAIGTTPVSYSVNADGAAKLSVPLVVPAGRAGLTPELALAYSSRNGNGLVGVGWSLTGMSRIHRCKRTAALDGMPDTLRWDRYDDRYCLDGERLVLVAGDHLQPGSEYRAEHERFARIVPTFDHDDQHEGWLVYGRDGKISRYGVRLDTRQWIQPVSYTNWQVPVASPQSYQVYAWHLDSVEDRDGNAILYDYEQTAEATDAYAHELRPSRIRYTQHPSAPATREVRFVYEVRPDRLDAWTAGMHQRVTQRLRAVQMWAPSPDGTPEQVRQYALWYRNDTITGRSLLAGLEECDRAGVCLPETRFDWSTGSWGYDVVDTGITDAGTSNSSDWRIYVTDVNGDGLDDLLYPDSTRTFYVRFSDGNGFGARVPAGLPTIVTDPLELSDFDRDGKTDVVAWDCTPGVGCPSIDRTVWQWNGTRYERRFAPAFGGGVTYAPHDQPAYLLDLDGNGLADLIESIGSPTSWYWQMFDGVSWGNFIPAYISQGPRSDYHVMDVDGDGRSELLRRPDQFADPAFGMVALGLNHIGHLIGRPTNVAHGIEAVDFRQADVNGDGLDDLVFPWDGLSHQINGGKGVDRFVDGPTDYHAPFHNEYSLISGSSGVIAEDVNADGRDDFVMLYPGAGTAAPNTGLELYISNGHGFERRDLPFIAGTQNSRGWTTTRTGDVDGDGLRDIVQLVGGQLRILRRQGDLPDHVIAVSHDLSGTQVRFAFKTVAEPGVHSRAATCVLPLRCVTRGITVATDLWIGNGVGGENHVGFSYLDGRVDLQGRGFLGFARRWISDDRTGLSTVTTYDNVTREGTDYPRAGLPLTSSQSGTLANGAVVEERIDYDWGTSSYHGGATRRAELRRRSTHRYETPPGGLHVPFQTVHEYFDKYDDFGNLLQSRSVIPGGRYSTRTSTYENRSAAWLIGLDTADRQTSCNAAGSCDTRTQTASYDSRGHLDHTTQEPGDPALRLETRLDYDAVGNVVGTARWDVAGVPRTSRAGYDADRIHLRWTENALGHTSWFGYHPGLGVLSSYADPNGVTYLARHDGFGRIRERHPADGAMVETHYVVGEAGPQAVISRQAGGDEVMTDFDALGRVVRQRSRAMNGSPVYVHTYYDAVGNVKMASRPRYATGGIELTTYQHDRIGRLLEATAPDGAIERYRYAAQTTMHFDAAGRRTRYLGNVDGDLAQLFEPHPTAAGEILTEYRYGPSGELEEVRDPHGNLTVLDHDALGRRTLVDEPDAGLTTTIYNAFGERTSETRADGSVASYQVDALGRTTHVVDADGETRLLFDGPGAIGRLMASLSPQGVVTKHEHDALGRPIATSWTIDGESFSILQKYDAVGRPSTTTYPTVPGRAPFRVTREYGQYGHLLSVRDPVLGQTFWRGEETDAEGHLTRESLGNGLVTERAFDPARGWMTGFDTTMGGAPILSMSYEHDELGRITRSSDLMAGRNESYDYDALDRLSRWEVDLGDKPKVRAGYEYDLIGNLLAERFPDVPSLDVDYVVGQNAGPHQLSSGTAGTWVHDTRGRQVRAPGRKVTYNERDLPTHVQRSGADTYFDYDAFGARVRKASAVGVTTYVGGIYERRNGYGASDAEHVFHVMAGGRVIAAVSYLETTGRDTSLYLHDDRLGSTLMVTDDGGAPIERFRYDPWGRRMATGAELEPLPDGTREGVRFGFTGHEHDDDLGLTNMNGRIFDPTTRRFLSADPVIADARASQTFNPYSYVWNNPTNLTDPSGFEGEAPDDCPECPTFTPGAGPDGYTENGTPIFDFGVVDIYGDAPATASPDAGVGDQVSDSAPSGFMAHLLARLTPGPTSWEGTVDGNGTGTGTSPGRGASDGVGRVGGSGTGNGNGGTADHGGRGGLLDLIHNFLDIGGLIPGIGEIADVVNGIIYAAEGDYTNAALSAGAAIPFAGWGATGAKWAGKADKAADAYRVADGSAGARNLVQPSRGGKGREVFERYGCEAEACGAAATNRLENKVTPGGHVHRNDKWIGQPGTVDPRTLGKSDNYTHKMTITTRPGATEWLEQNATKKSNEPGRFGIPHDKLDEFNHTFEPTIEAKPRAKSP